jgi:short subunit dehydrogenase-like uncharacterized protein
MSENPLALIGRDEAKLNALAASVRGTPTVLPTDIMNDEALLRACAGCQIVVNCGAPSSVILDRVAVAALKNGSHYVDPGGESHVFDLLATRREEIAKKGLTFTIGAGYVPGLAEMLMRAVYEKHRARTRTHCKVRLFVVDHNEWSLNGFMDIMDRFCSHPPEIGVYRRGRFERRSMLTAWLRRRLPGQPGAEVLMPVRWPEIEAFAREAKPLRAAVYMPMDPAMYAIGRFFATFLPNRTKLAATVARALFRLKAKRQGSGGMLYAEAAGRFGRAPLQWLIEVGPGRHYERTGQVAALAAALIADGTLDVPGLTYLAQAVDPHEFIIRLLPWGVETIDLGRDSLPGASRQTA